MTIDATGRAHKPAGSPASTGGQYAAQPTPGQAATLDRPDPESILSADLRPRMRQGGYARLGFANETPEEHAAYVELAAARLGIESIELAPNDTNPRFSTATATYRIGPDHFQYDDPDAIGDLRGAPLTKMLMAQGLQVEPDGDNSWEVQVRAEVAQVPTFRVADATIAAHPRGEALRRILKTRHGLEYRLARYERTGQHTLEETDLNAVALKYAGALNLRHDPARDEVALYIDTHMVPIERALDNGMDLNELTDRLVAGHHRGGNFDFDQR